MTTIATPSKPITKAECSAEPSSVPPKPDRNGIAAAANSAKTLKNLKQKLFRLACRSYQSRLACRRCIAQSAGGFPTDDDTSTGTAFNCIENGPSLYLYDTQRHCL